MNYPWLDEYCLSFPGVEKDYQEEWGAWRYKVGGKMFAMLCKNKEGQPIFTVKLEPLHGSLLREQYPTQVVPGYYMNRVHWNSLRLDSHSPVPEDVVRDMAAEGHRVTLASLSKKAQRDILGEA